MKNKMMLASVAALGLAACGGGSQENENNTSAGMAINDTGTATGDNMAAGNMAGTAAQSGQEYAAKASASDMFEIESSRVALQKSQNAQVKQFAQMLVADHQKSTTQLQSAAQQAQPAINVAPALDMEQQANMQALQAAGGQDFDRTYLQQQVQAHEKALALVQAYAQDGDVPGLKQHASTVSGPIQQHLQRAQQLLQQAGAAQ